MADPVAWIGALSGPIAALIALRTSLRASALERERGAIQEDLERTKADLQRIAVEHETRFSRLHERRMDVLDGLYKRLVRAERAFSRWLQPFQPAEALPERERMVEAVEAANEFRTCLLERRIYLDEDLVDRLLTVDRAFYQAFLERTTFPALGERGWRDPEARTLFREAWERVSRDVPAAREAIESAFRSILGVPELGRGGFEPLAPAEPPPEAGPLEPDAPESLNPVPLPEVGGEGP